MGAILAKFRKEKSTTQVLEDLEEKIHQIEKYSFNTQEQKKRIVGNFLATSIGVYVIAVVVFYFAYVPPTWREWIIYSIPLLLFPFIIILLRRVFTWYFERKINKNSIKLKELHEEKKKILEQVMDKETYKVAVKLLARYGGDKTNAMKLTSMTPKPNNNNQLSLGNQKQGVSQSQTPSNTITRNTLNYSFNTPAKALSKPTLGLPTRVGTMSAVSNWSVTPHNARLAEQSLRRRTPFPIINQREKGVFDRIVDVLIGDGPQDRFAMVCKECHAHNGMALKEDFEYTTFRCAFCNALNPSRKSRPVAPRLPEPSALHGPKVDTNLDSSDTSTSDDESDKPVRLGQESYLERTEQKSEPMKSLIKNDISDDANQEVEPVVLTEKEEMDMSCADISDVEMDKKDDEEKTHNIKAVVADSDKREM